MGLFSVSYQDLPGRGVIAQGGLKFRASEESLRRYFAPILPYVSLEDLIGEAVFWVLAPSTVAIWTFPCLLYFKGLGLAIAWTIGINIALHVVHLFVYVRALNYLIFVLSNRLLQLLAYVVVGTVFGLTGHLAWTIALGIAFLFYAVGLDVICFGVLIFPFHYLFVALPTSDQVLRRVGWYHGSKHGENPRDWKMYPTQEENRGNQ